MPRAFIAGCAGPQLSAREAAFFAAAQPAGLILFQRNCVAPEQVRALIRSFREAVARTDALILVDQEGGRVQRMQPPGWRALPAGAVYGKLYARNPKVGCTAAKLVSRLVAEDLQADGFNMNCAPVLDIPVDGAHGVIGDRAYGSDGETVVAIGSAIAEGLLEGGIVPVMKHLPGHGRATVDSHQELPVVQDDLGTLADNDFVPFKTLSRLPAAMTAHVVYSSLDGDEPASTSQPVVAEVIRRYMGFNGLLMSDDLSMRALRGSLAERARAVVAAGCDIALHCNGNVAEMDAVASNVTLLEGVSASRYATCIGLTERANPFDRDAALAVLKELLGGATVDNSAAVG